MTNDEYSNSIQRLQVFSVVFTFFMLGKTTSHRAMACLGIVIAGFFVGSKGEVHFSLIGSLFGVGSSVFVALNGILTERFTRRKCTRHPRLPPTLLNHTLCAVVPNQWELSAYNNINACILFLPLVLFFETGTIMAKSDLLFSPYYWFIMTLGGVFGFMINIATILQARGSTAMQFTCRVTSMRAGQAHVCSDAQRVWHGQGGAAVSAGLLHLEEPHQLGEHAGHRNGAAGLNDIHLRPQAGAGYRGGCAQGCHARADAQDRIG
jgi:hypothetical protein